MSDAAVSSISARRVPSSEPGRDDVLRLPLDTVTPDSRHPSCSPTLRPEIGGTQSLVTLSNGRLSTAHLSPPDPVGVQTKH